LRTLLGERLDKIRELATKILDATTGEGAEPESDTSAL
jgi:hypothetical protein